MDRTPSHHRPPPRTHPRRRHLLALRTPRSQQPRPHPPPTHPPPPHLEPHQLETSPLRQSRTPTRLPNQGLQLPRKHRTRHQTHHRTPIEALVNTSAPRSARFWPPTGPGGQVRTSRLYLSAVRHGVATCNRLSRHDVRLRYDGEWERSVGRAGSEGDRFGSFGAGSVGCASIAQGGPRSGPDDVGARGAGALGRAVRRCGGPGGEGRGRGPVGEGRRQVDRAAGHVAGAGFWWG